jgi:hypothetical protein
MNTTVPVSVPVPDVLYGVMVSVAPEAQYDYSCSPATNVSPGPEIV